MNLHDRGDLQFLHKRAPRLRGGSPTGLCIRSAILHRSWSKIRAHRGENPFPVRNESFEVLDAVSGFGRIGRIAEKIESSAFSPDEGGAPSSQNGTGGNNSVADADAEVNLPFPIHDSLSIDEAAAQLMKLEREAYEIFSSIREKK